MGMAGAYTAIAEGIDGATVNAASPAVREPYSFDWFDWDIDLDVSVPGEYGGTDFDNRGPQAASDPQATATVDGFFYAHAGLEFQLGEFGVSGTAEFFQYDVAKPNGQGVSLEYGRYHALAGYGLFDNQLVLGAGLRIVTLQVKGAGGLLTSGQTLVTLDGAGPEVGVVLKPNDLPLRVGATFRSAVNGTVAGLNRFLTAGVIGGSDQSTVDKVGNFVLPSRATLPWELEAGVAFQVGPRPLSPGWIDPMVADAAVRERIAKARARRARDDARELAGTPLADRGRVKREQDAREAALESIEDQRLDAEDERLRAVRIAREANWPRERILLVGGVLITGSSEDAVSLEGFVDQQRQTVGQRVSLSPRVGIESEPVPNWVHGRIGSYLEPSRFTDGETRQHFTFGADVKLFAFSPWGIFGDQVWRASFSWDLAPRYSNFGVGIGAWH